MQSPKPALKTDKRLLGNWRSDRESTVAEWRFTRRVKPQSRRWLLDIFGKLCVTYTPTRIRSVFDNTRFIQRYNVLASDTDSVAILYEDLIDRGNWCIEHIHFEGSDRFWVVIGRNREWFIRAAQPQRSNLD